MSKIRIKNFGPIKEGFAADNGFMDIKKVTVFIGNQGTGKSTIAKLISTLTWIEKALVRGDYPESEFTSYSRFIKKYCSYHRLENYFKDINGVDKAEIEYDGNAYHFHYFNERFTIKKNVNNKYLLPQVMYVPAERNFISTINNARMIKLSSGPLVEFLTEFDNAKSEIKESVALPINSTKIEYDRLNDIVNIKGKNDEYKVRLTEASSGFQSSVPLFLVSRFIAYAIKRQTDHSQNEMSSDEMNRFRTGVESIWSDKNLTEEQKRIALSALSSRFKKSAFINIVEEIEQNLFPTSQRQMLNCLIAFSKINDGNELILTTHSPYIINYLTLSVKGHSVLAKVSSSSCKDDLMPQLQDIIPADSTLASDELVIYEIDENGKIIRLEDYHGLPSDENYLNVKLGETNDLFIKLLEIEELCQ